jgi:hypothetical protein
VLQYQRRIGVAGVKKLYQKMLDLDIVMGPRQTYARRSFNCISSFVIEFSDQ